MRCRTAWAVPRRAKAVGALLLAGAIGSAFGTLLILKGEAFSSVGGFPVDSNNPEYCKVIFARRHGQNGGDTCATWADGTSNYGCTHLSFNPVLDSLDTLDITGIARDDTNCEWKLAFVQEHSLPVVRYLPIAFFDARHPPYDTLSPFGLSFRTVDTTLDPRMAGKGLVGKLKGVAYLQEDSLIRCTTTVFTNDRGPIYRPYVDVMWDLEKLRHRINDGDSVKLVIYAVLGESTYMLDTTVAVSTYLHGTETQGQMADTLKCIAEHVLPTPGIEEAREGEHETRGCEPTRASRMMSLSSLGQWIDDERRQGNDVRLYDALGGAITSGRAGRVNLAEITGRRGRSLCKIVCPSN
jgi:hypothetical protein